MTDLEFLREYAKCGIHHNHTHNESNLKHKLQILDAAVSAIDMLYKRLTVYEDQWLPSKQEQIDDLAEQLNKMEGRANALEEWLTEYRDQLKKENVYHNNTGIINAINELLDEA